MAIEEGQWCLSQDPAVNAITPPDMLSKKMGGVVTAVTELDDARIVMIMDVEKVLADTVQDSSSESWFKAPMVSMFHWVTSSKLSKMESGLVSGVGL